ncbi:MAG: histone deacetylase [Acidobacteria bacterium]|nr:histone deacetylase [Acidobacteriota bacterium]
MSCALLLDPAYKNHLTGEGHPERPERYDAVMQALERVKPPAPMLRIAPRAASEDEIALCHTREYIQTVKRDAAALKGTRRLGDLSTGDTVIGPASLETALLAAGGVLHTVDAVLDGKARTAFCAVRPPGHHATPDRGMGFCIFNNVAIAARYARRKRGVERVLIADWDVHHGNGTQDIFYADGSVFFFSTHQSPWYPGTGRSDETGEGKGKGRILNCPFPAGSGRKEISGAFRHRLVPAMDAFKPDLVILSAGFDSRMGDPLGRFTLTDAEFAELTQVCLEIAAKHAGGRLLSVLEGGYSLSGLAAAVTTHVQALVA